MSERLCPKCGSDQIVPAERRINTWDKWVTGISSQYVCDKCGYIGPIIIETDSPIDPDMEEDLKKLRKKIL